MAERRMFTTKIVDSDAFMDMPLSTQSLYFHLSMRADDDGFVNNPKKIQRMIGASEDDLKLLIAKRFILAFESGVIVIKHWRMHNLLRKDRYNPTQYQEEFKMLSLKENGAYTEHGNQLTTSWQPKDNQLATQDSIGKDSIGKDRLVKYSDDYSIINKLTNKEQDSILKLCDSLDTYAQLIRYADAKIKSRTDNEPISDPYQYLIAVGVNGGFIKED